MHCGWGQTPPPGHHHPSKTITYLRPAWAVATLLLFPRLQPYMFICKGLQQVVQGGCACSARLFTDVPVYSRMPCEDRFQSSQWPREITRKISRIPLV